MAKVIAGMNWHDLQAAIPVDEVLSDARDEKFSEVAVVGRARNGDIEVYATHPNFDAVIGLLYRGINMLADHEQLVRESEETVEQT